MPRNAIVRRAAIACVALILSACCRITGNCEACESSTDARTLTNSFNTFTVTGAPVATFRLVQEQSSSTGACGAGANDGPVALSITGIAPVPLRFEYVVQGVGATGLVVWSRAGSVPRLALGQTIDIGEIARSPVRVDVGARAFLDNVAAVP